MPASTRRDGVTGGHLPVHIAIACVKKEATGEKLQIVACVTGGDSDILMVGLRAACSSTK
jgi:hypothetical protein